MIRLALNAMAAASAIAVVALQPSPASAETAPPSEASQTIRLTVVANETTAYGTPWDGIRMGGIVGSLMPELPLTSPPDLAVCLVALEGEDTAMECHHNLVDGTPVSFCHDAFECSFDLPSRSGTAFGVVIYDIDTLLGDDRNDFVDAFLIAGPEGEIAAVEAATRAAVQTLCRTDVEVPGTFRDRLKLDRLTIMPNEQKRRSSAMRVIKRGDCEAAACRLTQSQVSISWR